MKILGVLLLAVAASTSPVSQPGYASSQYLQPQQPTSNLPLSLRQQPYTYSSQPQYISQPAGPSQPPPRQQYNQVLLPSTADQQVQRAAAQIAGPAYAQQVQTIQYQELANQAQAVAQRRAQTLALRQAQALRGYQPQPQQQSQPQYLQEVSSAAQNQRPLYQVAPRPHYQQQPQQSHQQQRQQEEQEEQQSDEYDANPSYQFGFDVKDDYYTNYQNRKEQREGNKISGSYSVVDSDGFIRTVTYTADPKEGFKAEVNRQPTDIVVKIPKPILPPPKQQQQYIQEEPDQRAHLQGQKQKLIYQYQ